MMIEWRNFLCPLCLRTVFVPWSQAFCACDTSCQPQAFDPSDTGGELTWTEMQPLQYDDLKKLLPPTPDPEYRFPDGATVRVAYRALKRQGLDRPVRATITILSLDGDSYQVKHEETGQEFTVRRNDVFGVCGCARPGYGGSCLALIHHGPGHQSHTHCRLKGEHEVHEAVYGSMRQFAEWTGDEVFSGFFDEPPDED